MKKLLLRTLFFLIPFLWWVYSSAQPVKESASTDCSCDVVPVATPPGVAVAETFVAPGGRSITMR